MIIIRKKIAKLVVVLGDYDNRQEKVDPGQIIRTVSEVMLFTK